MSMIFPFDAMQICVSKCPDRDLREKGDVKKFAEETGSRLCRYDVPIEDYDNEATVYGAKGPCPDLPVYAR